jgi:serine/threonine protein kinase
LAQPALGEGPLVSHALEHYRVAEKIGEGGMGVVYLARDEHLRRDVALKLLRGDLVSDKSRIDRFKHEAQVLASLNHSNIAAIYGIEQVNDSWALVMEFVSGMTLSERIAKGPLPLPEIASISRQLAQALKYAHGRGIIHRDLKPSNLKITPERVVKVLDFGLAKAVAPVSSDSSTTDSLALRDSSTTGGGIVGTAAYMSPEQARGQSVDQRTDVWAFGVVLFEMLTGKRAFGRSTTSDSIAAVLEHDPDWNTIPEKTPPEVVHVLKRCLAKQPDDRWHDIGDVALQLVDAFEMKAPVDSTIPLHRRTLLEKPIVWPILALAIIVITAGYFLWNSHRSSPLPIHLSIPLPSGTQLTSCPAISRDGRVVAFTSRTQTGRSELYLRQLDWPEAKLMPGTDNAYLPFFSPDAKWVAFFSRGHLVKAEIATGSMTTLADAPDPWGGTWGNDGYIIFVPSFNSGLVRIPSAGGAVEKLTRPNGQNAGYAHVYPHFLEDGRRVVFAVWSPAREYGGIALLSLNNQQWRLIVPGWTEAAYPEDGNLVVGAGGEGLKVASLGKGDAGTISLDRTALNQHVAYLQENALSWFGVSQTGTLMYVPADFTKATLVWVDRDGKMQTIVEEQQDYQTPAVSPDGNRLAVRIGGDLWVYDLRRSTRTRLTFSGYNAVPMWTLDGSDVVYSSNRGGDLDLYRQPASGTGEARRLLQKESIQLPCSIAPDGTIGFTDIETSTGRDIWTLSPDGKASPLLASPFNETSCRFSPDGRFIAYMSEESGLRELYVQPYPGPGDKVAISTDGGSFPVWSADGRELFYRHGDDVMVVEVSREPRFSVSRARLLFTGKDPGFRDQFDVSPDGKRFLMVHREPGCLPSQIDIIVNWHDEVK